MKKRISLLFITAVMGLTLIGSGGCCHVPRHHGGNASCCQTCACCESAATRCGKCSSCNGPGWGGPRCANPPAGCPKAELQE